MAQKIPERVQWAVNTLEIAPGDHVLEIGCGNGSAVSLICNHLADGKITAIDRSETMIARAVRNNEACIESGKAEFHIASLEDADFGGEIFNKIFAINVNLFWTKSGAGLDKIKDLLAPGGSFYLFYEPPSEIQAHEIGDSIGVTLRENGFPTVNILVEDTGSGTGMRLVAQTT